MLVNGSSDLPMRMRSLLVLHGRGDATASRAVTVPTDVKGGRHRPTGAADRLGSLGEASARTGDGTDTETVIGRGIFPGLALRSSETLDEEFDRMPGRAAAKVGLAAVVQHVHVGEVALALRPPPLGRVRDARGHHVRDG